jgi:hypothetical protein
MGAATLTQASALSYGHDKTEKRSGILMLLFALLEVSFFDAHCNKRLLEQHVIAIAAQHCF